MENQSIEESHQSFISGKSGESVDLSGSFEIGDIPADVRCDSKHEMVLLSAQISYFSKITRLAAIEKGLNWRHYVVNMGQNQHVTPWYLKINPNGVVPSMLVGE